MPSAAAGPVICRSTNGTIPNQNQWTVLPTPFIGQWRGLGLAAMGNDLYVLGGWTGQYQAVVEKYNPFPFSIFVPAATR